MLPSPDCPSTNSSLRRRYVKKDAEGAVKMPPYPASAILGLARISGGLQAADRLPVFVAAGITMFLPVRLAVIKN
jgi:hypothetical protein